MIEFTESNFQSEVLESDVPVLVDFWATWCAPCLKIAPMVQELENEYDGKLKVGKVNVENAQSLAQQYGVRSIPTLLFFKDGNVASQIIGMQAKRNLVAKIEELM